jgi:hypothetical protein
MTTAKQSVPGFQQSGSSPPVNDAADLIVHGGGSAWVNGKRMSLDPDAVQVVR